MSGRYYSRRIGGKKEPFILRVDTTLGDGLNQMRLPIRGDNMKIKTSDGQNINFTQNDLPNLTNNLTINFSASGIYDIEITNLEHIRFNNEGDKLKPTKVVQWGEYVFESFTSAFQGCENLEIPMSPTFNVSGNAALNSAFQNIAPIPSLDKDFLKNLKGNHFSVTMFRDTIIQDGIVPSGFFSSTNEFRGFANIFNGCGLTTFPPNELDNQKYTGYFLAFSNNNLNQESVDNILVSVNTGRKAGNHIDSDKRLSINGGTNATPSQAGKDAADELRGAGWTVDLNGY